MESDADLRNVQFDWYERSKALVLEVDQQKAQALGVNRHALTQVLQGGLSGLTVGQYREDNRLISIVLRGSDVERRHVSAIGSLSVPTLSGAAVPLSQIAHIVADQEEGYLWHRNREPTLTVRADIYGGTQAPVISVRVDKKLDAIRAQLPPGYRIDMGGAIEESAKANASIAKGMPLFLMTVLTLLMIQLQSFQRVILVVLTAPLGIIGVTLSLLLLNQPFGFVAMLGTIALSGMIMRNSVILIDQIERNLEEGMKGANAIIDAAVLRFRPIMLTAMAAILAMIPLSHSVFFGPMAVAIMGGLFVATLLTLLFLPALYALWFKIRLE
jgi:multidrug efflux pump